MTRRPPIRTAKSPIPRSRRLVVMGMLGLAAFALVARVVHLQVMQHEFLQKAGAELSDRTVPMPAHRGMITDRMGSPLAVSTPVSSIWADPRMLSSDDKYIGELARALGMHTAKLQGLLRRNSKRGFVYLKRRAPNEMVAKVKALDIKGLGFQREYKRFYPAGRLTGQLLGFTNIDDRGSEGLERAFDKTLAGIPGKRRVVRDRLGRIVDSLGVIQPPRPGGELQVSIDRRIQYLAHEALKKAVRDKRAKGGSTVVLDVRSGEILAMVNQPDFDPNDGPRKPADYRNRAVTDLFEPGSTMKSFIIAAGLDSGSITPSSRIDTRPGFIKVGRKTIKDHHRYGVISPTKLLTKSSNVGAVKVARSLDRDYLHQFIIDLGIGQPSHSGLPGEARGRLAPVAKWGELSVATMAFGYGLSTNLLQLAGAYAVIAADGVRRPISLHPVEGNPKGKRVMSVRTASQLREMLETVVLKGGTATRAQVAGYRVAGKTGTVRKAVRGGYSSKHYQGIFVGMAPISRPRLVVATIIDEPGGREYYGGLVAAPVVGEILSNALRLLDVAPDDVDTLDRYVALWGKP
jgi:cell division protein FtsI (penicillin-binding protein 3)